MPDIQAFRALRYDLGHVGALCDVVAPPYDVISPQMQEQLYDRHPLNVVRLILNREQFADDQTHHRYQRAAQFFKQWQSDGVLQADPDPGLYVYHQQFEERGRQLLRRGFMARVRLERFGEGSIYPHEETHSSAKADRLRLMKACRANLSQVFGLYPDEENAAQLLLEQAIAGRTPLEATDDLGVVHRMWSVTDVRVIGEVMGLLSLRPLFIADGHHRYETACNYRDQLAALESLDPEHPANFVLAMCVSMSDPGMVVLPTHRLFRGLGPLTSQQLIDKLQPAFQTLVGGQQPEAASEVWEMIEADAQQGTIGLYAPGDRRWVLASITPGGLQRMAELAPEHSPQWHSLGVSILHRLILDDLLGAHDLPQCEYVHQVQQVQELLEQGDPQGGHFGLAALVMPASLEHIQAISRHGERMPAKSTYFYPKLLSGLIFNPLE
jgi:uncharacterized protein (DUF1015 family)